MSLEYQTSKMPNIAKTFTIVYGPGHNLEAQITIHDKHVKVEDGGHKQTNLTNHGRFLNTLLNLHNVKHIKEIASE